MVSYTVCKNLLFSSFGQVFNPLLIFILDMWQAFVLSFLSVASVTSDISLLLFPFCFFLNTLFNVGFSPHSFFFFTFAVIQSSGFLFESLLSVERYNSSCQMRFSCKSRAAVQTCFSVLCSLGVLNTELIPVLLRSDPIEMVPCMKEIKPNAVWPDESSNLCSFLFLLNLVRNHTATWPCCEDGEMY